jgi:peptidyl-prolyl cis-trans isomerase B (cyclophilin B)
MNFPKFSSMRAQSVAALLLYPLAAAWAQPAAKPASYLDEVTQAYKGSAASSDKAATAPNPANDMVAVIQTELGTFRMEFAPDKAPKHVEQFIKLSQEGFYDGTGFFRVGKGHIDGGDPNTKDPKAEKKTWGSGGMDMLSPEFNDMKFDRGVVATFHAFKHGDGAQFFILVTPQPLLERAFTAFGRVTEGMDVIDKISQAPAAENGITDSPVRILKITIEKKKGSETKKVLDGEKKVAVEKQK